MKRRKLLVALVLTCAMLLSACGGDAGKLVGKWNATLDLTDYIVQEMVAQDPSLEAYAKFENLSFTFQFEFTKDTVALTVDEASTQQFITNAETGIINMIDAMVADMAAEANETPEDVFAGMNMTRETFIKATMNSLRLESMVKEMVEVLTLSGSYVAEGDTITVIYEDNTYEEMKFAFGKEDLTITVSDGTNNFVFVCKEAK